MTEAHPEIVIVRRRGLQEDEHHGGAWKIAFADFMTAMMAFFLVLWIISATDKNTKTLIARYFNPVKVEEPAKAQKGIHGAPEKDAAYAPGDETGTPSAGKPSSESGEGGGANANANSASSSKQNEQARPPTPSPVPPPDPAKPYPTMSEQELFRDPPASLDKIAGAPPPGPRIDASAALKGYGEVGPSADEALRDPFRPLGSDQAVNVVTDNPGAPPAAAAPSDEPVSLSTSIAPAAAPAPEPALAQGAGSPAPSTANPPTPDPVTARQTAAFNLLADLNKRLAGELKSMQGPQLDVQATEEGILISLTDRQNFSMFAIGSAEPQRRVLRMMEAIAASLQNLQGAIVVRGHTDGRPYRSATYDNWRLSSARAQMAYYMLIRGGLPEKRVERVEGYADHRLRDASHPLAAENRRIEISRTGGKAVRLPRLASALAAFAVLTPVAAVADSAHVSGLVDELRGVQFRIAQGDKAAYAAQLSQLKTIGAAIASASPETWKNKREADSLVIYILSGGSLANVEPLLKGDELIESEQSLARGALAYVTNHEANAIALLNETDLTTLDTRLAGEVAFARSVLETKRDAKAAVDLLDWARLVEPGGLVEEAALRREIALLAEAKDASRLATLTRQYVTRFAASLYAADFFRDLAGAVARLGLADDSANYKLLSSAVATLSTDERREFLLTLAKSGVVSAHFVAAASAATEALESSKADSPEAMRARLYLAASRLFSDAYDAAIADLKTLSVSNLDRADASLLAAVRRVAAELRIAPDIGVFNTENAVALPDADKDKPSGPALTIAQAQAALQRTSSLAPTEGVGPP